MILTNNRDFYENLKNFRHHGIIKKPSSFASTFAKAAADKKATEGKEKGPWYYEIENPGYNYRITDFQCALGLSQLKKIDKFIRRRREIVEKYNYAFKDIKEIVIPKERNYVKSAWHIYVIQLCLDKLRVGRKKIFELLQREGLGVQVHYMPIHLHSFYRDKFGYEIGDFPIAERYYQGAITLPLFPRMTNEEVDRVIKIVKKTLDFYRK